MQWHKAAVRWFGTAAQKNKAGMPWCSVLLSKTKLPAALCYCIYTHGVLIFLQGCIPKPKMHCSRVKVKIHALLLSAAEQDQADSSLLPLHLHP